MLVVNNSKNPAHDAESLAKYSKVGEEAGPCCNHGKNPGVRPALVCFCPPSSHLDVFFFKQWLFFQFKEADTSFLEGFADGGRRKLDACCSLDHL